MSATVDAGSRRWVPVALVVAVVSISFAAIFFKRTAPTDPLVAAGWRLLIAGTLLLPLTLRGARAGRLTGRLFWHGTVAGGLYGLHFGAWVTSLHLTSVAASVTLVTSTPLLLAIVALVTGRDRPSARLWGAIGLAAVGVGVIGLVDSSGASGSLLGDGLALLGAAAMAGYMLVGRRLGAALDVWLFAGVATLSGGLVLLLAAIALGVPLMPATDEAWGFIVLAALFPQLVGHSLLTWSLRHVQPTVVGMATVGEPVGATLLGWLWLGEGISSGVAVGSVITASAVCLAVWRPRSTSALAARGWQLGRDVNNRRNSR